MKKSVLLLGSLFFINHLALAADKMLTSEEEINRFKLQLSEGIKSNELDCKSGSATLVNEARTQLENYAQLSPDSVVLLDNKNQERETFISKKSLEKGQTIYFKSTFNKDNELIKLSGKVSELKEMVSLVGEFKEKIVEQKLVNIYSVDCRNPFYVEKEIAKKSEAEEGQPAGEKEVKQEASMMDKVKAGAQEAKKVGGETYETISDSLGPIIKNLFTSKKDPNSPPVPVEDRVPKKVNQ